MTLKATVINPSLPGPPGPTGPPGATTIAGITGLQDAIDSKFDKSGGRLEGDLDLDGSDIENVTEISGFNRRVEFETGQIHGVFEFQDELIVAPGFQAGHAVNKGQLDTKADLVGGRVPASQLPGFVDDVLEFADLASFPVPGQSGKLYVATDTNLTYRWTGLAYVSVGGNGSLALGVTSSTAYRGDQGKAAFDYSQVGHVPLSNVGTATGNVLALVDVDGSPGLPAIDGSQLTNLPAGNPFDQDLNTTDSPTFLNLNLSNRIEFSSCWLRQTGAGGQRVVAAGTSTVGVFNFGQFGITLSSDQPLGFCNSSNIEREISQDTTLRRDDAGILAQRNGSNAQTHRIYGTYTSGSGTDASNDIVGEWLSLGYNGSEFEIATKAGASGGTVRDLLFKTQGFDRLKIDTSGHTRVFSGRFLYFSHSSSANGIAEIGGKLLISSAGLLLQGMPTTDPLTAGEVWNDSGTLKISAG